MKRWLPLSILFLTMLISALLFSKTEKYHFNQRFEHLVIGADTRMNLPHSTRILCFGDSITEDGRWFNRVQQEGPWTLLQAGVSGSKAKDAPDDLPYYFEKYPDINALIIFKGVNDLPSGSPGTTEEKVQHAVEGLSKSIDYALAQGVAANRILLLAPCNVNTRTMSAWYQRFGFHEVEPGLRMMETAYQELANKKGVHFLSLLNVVSPRHYYDGLHPDARGQWEIAEALLIVLGTSSQ